MTNKCDPDDYEAGSFATLQIITGVRKTMLILNRHGNFAPTLFWWLSTLIINIGNSFQADF